MAMDKLKGVKLQGGTYYVRIVIPADLRPAFGGKGELWETLGTGNPHDAVKMAPPIREKFKRLIADARAGRSPGETTVEDARAALAVRRAKRTPPKQGMFMSREQARWVSILEAVVASPEGWKTVPRFDELVASTISSNRRVDPSEPVVATMRQEVAALLLEEATQLHQNVAAEVFLKVARKAAERTPSRPLPAPSLSLRKLFDEWMKTKPVNDKEAGRREHQIRRLIEVVGDKPANHLTKADVREFMDLVVRFPGRKRSVEMNILPMRKLVEKFEVQNAQIAKRNAARVEVAEAKGVKPTGLEEVPTALRAATVGEWFGTFRQMFEYAVAMHDFEYNPFEATRKFVAKGGAALKKREFTAEEINTIFSAPLFNGFDGDGLQGYRNAPGTTLVRDVKYWLPILALFHAGRLTEFAAMPHADLKQDGAGHWYFDLTERQVKNETSQRIIPLHPEVEKLGFLDYVAGLRRGNSPWLFPDLDHETKHGPGHSFSKWWGHWMDARGMPDKSITYHSWRHTWKRAARQSEVKEEMHDVISGHKGTVSRNYGQGADIGPLARDMALIVFPTFPKLPVLTAEAAA